MGEKNIRGSGGRKSPSGVQGRSPGRGAGGRSPPEAEAFSQLNHAKSGLFLMYFSISKRESESIVHKAKRIVPHEVREIFAHRWVSPWNYYNGPVNF